MDAVRAQLEYFTHVRTNFDTVPKLLLSKQLAELAPGDLNRVTYTLMGSSAVEGAMKLAIRNKPGRKYFLSFWDGYSGRSLATMDLSYPHPTPFLQYVGNRLRVPQPYCYRCPYAKTYPACNLYCVEMIGKFIENSLDERPMALVMEPIQASGGMIPFPEAAYPALRSLCDRYDMLLIWDEIQTGFGRLGTMFAADLYQTIPDILIFGKAIGGGFPLAGQPAARRPARLRTGRSLLHLRALSDLDGRRPGHAQGDGGRSTTWRTAARSARTSRRGCREMQDKYELLGDVRGPGLMIGIELVKNRETKEPAREEDGALRRRGLQARRAVRPLEVRRDGQRGQDQAAAGPHRVGGGAGLAGV